MFLDQPYCGTPYCEPAYCDNVGVSDPPLPPLQFFVYPLPFKKTSQELRKAALRVVGCQGVEV